jgi:hypothetical protein
VKKTLFNHADLFRLAMEEAEIKAVLARNNQPRHSCFICSCPATRGVIWLEPGDFDPEYPADRPMASYLCEPCIKRGSHANMFRYMVYVKMFMAFKRGEGRTSTGDQL